MDSRAKQIEGFNALKTRALCEFERGSLEKALDYACVVATNAWIVHLGIWYDEELEQLLAKIGLVLNPKTQGKAKYETEKEDSSLIRIAHVASALYNTGGHSRLLKQNVEMFARFNSEQSIYLTNVTNSPTEFSFLNESKDRGFLVKQLFYKKSYVDRIVELVEYFENDNPDIAVLYTHPHDVIAVAAISALRKKPYTVFVNHADHVFWLDRNILDLCVEYRRIASELSVCVRKIDPNKICIIPITTNIKPKRVSRKIYGIPENATLSISIGSSYKILGDPDWNYFRTINQVLELYPEHYHLLVTDTNQNDLRKLVNDRPDIKNRFIIGGPFYDLGPIYGIGDFVIETFPFAGGMVRVESIACGLPIIAIKNSNAEFLTETDALPSNYPYIASTEKEIIYHCRYLIENPDKRKQIGQELYSYFVQNMSPEVVADMWQQIILNRQCDDRCKFFNSHRFSADKLDDNYVFSLVNKFRPHKELLVQASLKKSQFNISDRIKFYIDGFKEKEYTGIESFKYLLLAIGGFHLASTYHMIGNCIKSRSNTKTVQRES
jgi:glycosyltransferase involved in cell wall biosynthesis